MASGSAFSFIWKLTLALLAVAIIGAGLFWLAQSPLVSIDDIVIDGNHVVTGEQIMQTAGPLLRGQSIIHPPFDTVRAELDNQPFIEGIDFERDLPHTIIIHVREYRPQLLLKAGDGKNYLLASDGRVLMEQAATPQPAGSPPVLAVSKPCGVEIGTTTDCADVLTAGQFVANIPVSFNYQFAELTIADGDIRARTSSGVNVHFGSLEQYGLKFEVLRQLLARASVTGVPMTIDVSVPERPVTKDDRPPARTAATAASENQTAEAQTGAAGNGSTAAGAGETAGTPDAAGAGAAGGVGGTGAEQTGAPATETGRPQVAH